MADWMAETDSVGAFRMAVSWALHRFDIVAMNVFSAVIAESMAATALVPVVSWPCRSVRASAWVCSCDWITYAALPWNAESSEFRLFAHAVKSFFALSSQFTRYWTE